MKISLVITEGAKQIMLTPETNHEKEALAYIAKDDVLRTVRQVRGAFASVDEHVDFQVAECQGGYYRAFETEDSLMFVIKQKSKTKK